MNSSRQDTRHSGSHRTLQGNRCPSCGYPVSADAQWCGSCRFTGADSMTMFEGPAPPLLPLLDAADLWDAADLKKIEAAREKIHRRFPQFRFHIFTVCMPDDVKLPLFGFWLLNACPLAVGETDDDRAWTVLLLINAKTGQAAVIPGYAAEHWIPDDDWKKVLTSMGRYWMAGKTADAVNRFFETASAFLEHTWKSRRLRRNARLRS